MKIAFYAPMKSPAHPVPSGDRAMARLLVKALQAGGFNVHLASSFRSWDSGTEVRARRLARIGARQIDRVLRRFKAANLKPDLWFTYHVYYKAPDYIGPAISKVLGIPYVIAEASYAPGRKDTFWSFALEEARTAIAHADLILNLNPRDEAGVRPLLKHPGVLRNVKPFIDVSEYDPPPARDALRARFAEELKIDRTKPWLITAAMMRPGDKFSSYEIIARSLSECAERDFCLLIAGDGEAREEVERLFENAGIAGCSFLGLLDKKELFQLLAAGDVFIWPAVNEAYGMVFLEAQYAGLPIVAGNNGGVGALVEDGVTGVLLGDQSPANFAGALSRLLGDADLRSAMGVRARDKVIAEHNLTRVASEIKTLLPRPDGRR